MFKIKKIIFRVFLVIIILFLYGCSYPIRFVEFETSKTLLGTLGMGDHSIEVKMISGEILRGTWACSSDTQLGAGFLTYQKELASLLTVSGSGQHKCYAILTGDNKTVMELMFMHNEMGWSPHGYGMAMTNKGETYRIVY